MVSCIGAVIPHIAHDKQSESDAVRMVVRIVEAGQRNGQFRETPLPLTAFLLVRMFFAYVLDYEKGEDSEQELMSILKQMLSVHPLKNASEFFIQKGRS